MADETFEIGFVVSGQGDASKAFEDLKLAEMEAKGEAAELAAELKRLKDSGTATAEEIEEVARAMIRAKQAASQLASDARKVDRAQRAQADATATAVQTQRAQAQAAQASTQAHGQLIQTLQGQAVAVGALALSIATMHQRTTSANTELDRMGRSLGTIAQGASAGAGFGPLGAAIGATVGAVQSLVTELRALEGQQTRTQASTESLTDRLAAMVRTIEQQDRARELASGLASTNEIMAETVRVTRERIAAEQILAERQTALDRAAENRRVAQERLSQAQFDGAENTEALARALSTMEQRANRAGTALGEVQRQVQSLSQREADLARGLQQAQQREQGERAAAEARREEDQRRERARSAAQARRAEREREAQAILALERTTTAAEVEIFRGSRDQMRALELDHFESQLDAFRAYLDQRRQMQAAETVWHQQELDRVAARDASVQRDIDAERAAMDETDRQRSQVSAQLFQQDQQRRMEAADAERTHYEQQVEEVRRIEREMWGGLAGTVTSAAGDMISFLISGAEGGGDAFLAMLDSFLEATSTQYTIKALAEAAEAVAAAARYDFAAAGQHAAAAGLAAGVAAATGLASAAINVPQVGAASNAPAQAQPQQQAAGPTNYTIQLYAPQAVFTEAERGQIIAGGLREARRQMGPGAVRY